MKKLNILINGFGRIGRTTLKNIIDKKINLNKIFVNDITKDFPNLTYLYNFDSTYGSPNKKIIKKQNNYFLNNKEIIFFSKKNIINDSLKKYKIDLFIDSSGIEFKKSYYKKILKICGVKKIIITKSSENSDFEVIMGINDHHLSRSNKIISNSICDANAISHVLKIINEKYFISNGSITTLHPWLSYQNLVDGLSISQSNPNIPWNDHSLGRSSINNLIPKNTTAFNAITKILPELKNKMLSFSYRIPTDIVASADITLLTRANINLENLINLFRKNKNINLIDDHLVSIDYKKNDFSCNIDLRFLKTNKNLIKLIIWYDNEWGYCSTIPRLIKKIFKK